MATGSRGVGQDDLVGQAGAGERVRLPGHGDQAHQAARAGVPGGGEGQRAGLAGRPEHRDVGAQALGPPPGHDTGHERGRAADVHDGEHVRLVEVVGHDGGDAAGEEHRVATGRHLLPRAVPALEVVLQVQRGQGEADQGRDALAHLQPEGALGPDLGDRAQQHAAGARHRVVHLAPAAHEREHGGAHPVGVVVVALPQLAGAGGVEVEPVDVDADLAGPQLRTGVEDLGGLRQHPRGREHPVQADRGLLRTAGRRRLGRGHRRDLCHQTEGTHKVRAWEA